MTDTSRTGPVAVEIDDSTVDDRVIDYAALEARSLHTDLLLVVRYHPHAAYSPMTPLYLPADPRTLAQDAVRRAERRAHRTAGPGLTVRSMVEQGSRKDVLARAARTARLIVVGRHRSPGPQRAVAIHRDLLLVSVCACPLTVVPLGWHPSLTDRTVYVAVDGSAPARLAVGFAGQEAAARRGRLVLVHADRTSLGDAGGDLADFAAAAVADLSSRYPDLRVTRLLSARTVIETLLNASLNAGQLVLAAHPGRLPHDPVVRRILAVAGCPVTVVTAPRIPAEHVEESAVVLAPRP